MDTEFVRQVKRGSRKLLTTKGYVVINLRVVNKEPNYPWGRYIKGHVYKGEFPSQNTGRRYNVLFFDDGTLASHHQSFHVGNIKEMIDD